MERLVSVCALLSVVRATNPLAGIADPATWGPHLAPLEPACRVSLQHYLAALDNGTAWAVRLADASGRYASQFFFGNDFWLGSRDLCAELSMPPPGDPNPPLDVSFHVAKLQLALAQDLTPQSRVVLLGVCLPRTCSSQDISSLLQSSGQDSSRSLRVLQVRAVPGTYSLLADYKFHILSGVFIALVLLMLVGSTYEQLSRQLSPGRGNQSEETAEKPRGGDSTAHKPGLAGQVLLCFSVQSNGSKILQCGVSEESLTCVHGLRFISLAWVILVHTYLQVFAIAENKTLRSVTERNFMFQTISNATFSVDTFFFISGLLVTFVYLKASSKRKSDMKKPSLKTKIFKLLYLMLYRFIRLTPAYLFVLGVVEVSVRWVRNNTVFEPSVANHINCAHYWWRNALYINSLFPNSEMCMLWSWYMANDTQFYILGILLLLFVGSHFRIVAAFWIVILASSWSTTALVSYFNNYEARIQAPFALFDELYDKPWTRVGPYLVGLVTGWLLFRTNCRLNMTPVVVAAGWLLSLSCMCCLVYGLLHLQLGVVASAAYVALGHTAWAFSLSWVVLACCAGYGGVVNNLLSFRALYPLSRLTYCAYLVHPVIMVLTTFLMDGPLHLHNGIVVILYLGNVVAAFLLAFLISLAFEAPVVRLLKLATGTSQPPPPAPAPPSAH
ncbi:nose resistant to fluoxetine protein 6-like [Bacillus rossius redtenbacheri]|uniref:nose resistant to fluoxetine protein 6-like n=1 Tax=Bacillus rossius redtenbacheri TaxID=93214 RepID=UPI002FDD7BDC